MERNELTPEADNRMPVILHQADYVRWLDRGDTERPPVDLLRPYEVNAMTATACNPLVGNPRNNGVYAEQHMIYPVTPDGRCLVVCGRLWLHRP